MITTGVTGGTWRASITPFGGVVPWDDAPQLNWYVAADDRWHTPAGEATVRQIRVEGTPVVETRLRVPNGDVVQRIFSVVDGGGLTVIEVENESTMPVAVAFDGRDVVTERPIADVPIEGIDLPPDAFVLPLGHAATLRIALAHDDDHDRVGVPRRLPTATQVARGWLALTERAGRFVLPDGERGAGLAEAVTAHRCELALGSIAHAADPVGFALGLGELVRMGDDPTPWIPELVEAVEQIGPTEGWQGDVALASAGRALAAAGERRARRDLDRIVAARASSSRPDDPPGGVADIAWLEGGLVDGPALLPHGIPDEWLGQAIEVYGIPTGDRSTVSYALRWHGARPAVLWEQSGPPVELHAPAAAPEWSSRDLKGEALWPDPRV